MGEFEAEYSTRLWLGLELELELELGLELGSEVRTGPGWESRGSPGAELGGW